MVICECLLRAIVPLKNLGGSLAIPLYSLRNLLLPPFDDVFWGNLFIKRCYLVRLGGIYGGWSAI